MGDFFFGLEPIRALWRAATPLWDAIFLVITTTGSLLFFLVAVVLVYWLWDKRLGLYLSVLLLASGALNAYLKALLGLPRPPSFFHKTLFPVTDNGFPSGHAQNTAAFWSGLALVVRSWWIWVAVVLIVLVAFSRVYLGVHFVGDVLGGVAIGLGVAVVAFLGYRASFWGRLDFLRRIILAVALPATFGGILVLLGGAAYLFGGLLTGLSLGYVLEAEWVGMERPRTTDAGALRIGVGVPVVAALSITVMRVSAPLLVVPLFFALGLVVALLLPWAFVRLEAVLLDRKG